MPNVEETVAWNSGIYQIEIADAVLGGADAPANVPHQQLANRTAYLKSWQDKILDLLDDDEADGKKLPPASDSVIGVSRLATAAEITAGAANDIVVTPLRLAAALAAQAALLMPVGTIIEWPLSTPPDGFLELNGAAISRSVYAALFARVGTIWGAGDGATTFLLRDDRGEFKRGWDNGRGVDAGRGLNSWQDSEAKYSRLTSVRTTSGATNNVTVPEDGESSPVYVDGLSISGTYGPRFTNTLQGSETRPRNIAVMYCVKY